MTNCNVQRLQPHIMALVSTTRKSSDLVTRPSRVCLTKQFIKDALCNGHIAPRDAGCHESGAGLSVGLESQTAQPSQLLDSLPHPSSLAQRFNAAGNFSTRPLHTHCFINLHSERSQQQLSSAMWAFVRHVKWAAVACKRHAAHCAVCQLVAHSQCDASTHLYVHEAAK